MKNIPLGSGPSSSPTYDKIAIFIDGANLFAAARALEFDMDYRRLLKWGGRQGRLVRALYYTTLLEDQDYSPIRPLVDWLDYNGYTMVTKPAREYTDSSGRRKIKGQTDVELAVDMLELAPFVDHIYLFSGDGDFARLVQAVQRKGVRVTVVSTVKSNPPMVSDELRRAADHFLDLDDILEEIQRDPSTVSTQRAPRDEVTPKDADDTDDTDPEDDTLSAIPRSALLRPIKQ